MKYSKYLHPYHIVTNSPWPFFLGLSSFCITNALALYMHGYLSFFPYVFYSFYFGIIVLGLWWRDIVREGTYEGQHTLKVQKNLKIGFALFIFSEIMFFFGFFWAFFHSSLVPTLEIGGIWPPAEIIVISAWGLPFFNTMCLLTSGVWITLSHIYLRVGDEEYTLETLGWTILFGFLFLIVQFIEYYNNPTRINDGVYGSLFYMLTGFHGFHVLVGTIFLIVNLVRFLYYHFTPNHHIGFESAIWYWHFVDVIWIFLFLFLYIWGGK